MLALPIAELARVICLPGSKYRVMALLRAYCDASFTETDFPPGWTAVGGYVGAEEAWTDVERQWAENKKLWNLPEFSIAKIFAGETSVGFTNAEICVRSFGKIIGRSALEGVSAAVNNADWEREYKGERFPSAYHLCVSMLFHIIDTHVRLQFPGDHVAVFLDADRKGKALDALCDVWRKESKLISSISFGLRTQYPLLECADLCVGTERIAQRAGGWATVLQESKWYRKSHAHRHRGIVWSLEDQKRAEEALAKREERKRRRRRDGKG